MDTVKTNIDGCNIDHEAHVVEEYGEEVMCAGWNPQLTLGGEGPIAQGNRHANLPADLAITDVDVFLKRMYEYQC